MAGTALVGIRAMFLYEADVGVRIAPHIDERPEQGLKQVANAVLAAGAACVNLPMKHAAWSTRLALGRASDNAGPPCNTGHALWGPSATSATF